MIPASHGQPTPCVPWFGARPARSVQGRSAHVAFGASPAGETLLSAICVTLLGAMAGLPLSGRLQDACPRLAHK